MKMYSKEGVEMMHVASVKRENDDLVVKGKMMGAMTMSIYMRPEDLWSGKGLLTWSVIRHIPVMIFKGMWRSIRSKKA